ncbi:fructokinase-1 [Coffea arabica]|uniref:Fructokinase-1 n=1 Tax=Coffea arabica TaxID=13443 RepID=A0A6P6UY50_COFAR
MHLHHAISFKSPIPPPPNYALSPPYPTTIHNPTSNHFFHSNRNIPSSSSYYYCSIFNCSAGIQIPLPKQQPLNSLSFCNSNNASSFDVDVDDDERLRNVGVIKEIDVATLGNLCVDIVLNVPRLPPKPLDQRKAYLDDVSKSPPDKRNWEAGGNCNMAIAAARLGLSCATIGHVGDEIYGQFLLDVLEDEGISVVRMDGENDEVSSASAAYETLLCWVLVDPMQRHGFCSRADFSNEPAFVWMKKLSPEAKKAIKHSKILFCNGYGFDELAPSLLVSALEYAVEVGTSVFFDPGPRGKTLHSGSPDEQRALSKFLRMSDVLLLTSEEAESLTGIGNPVLAGQELLRRGTRMKWVIIKMGAKGSLLITTSSISCSPAFKVDVIDTVGCGDSFVAAIAFGFIHKMPLVHTLMIANAVGAATAMGCGAGRNVASLEQVIELVRRSDLNEDDSFWMDLLDKDLDVEQITLLSNMVINGSNGRLSRLCLEKVALEMLQKLEHVRSQKGVGGGAPYGYVLCQIYMEELEYLLSR